jgi:tagatose 6-phosphate kinase
VNAIESSTGRQTEFLEPGPPLSPETLEDFLERFGRLAADSSVVCASGSLPRGAPPDLYGILGASARKTGARTIVDAGGESLREALMWGPDLVKPNLEEAGALLGRKLEGQGAAASAALAMMEMGAGRVAVSMGPDGVVFACPEGVIHAIPPSIKPVNTVGCGDSMVAGFAWGLSLGWDSERTVRFAVALSAASAFCEETGDFRDSDLEDLLPLVEIKRLF